MRIYIPTLFRNQTQITANRLPTALLKNTVMVLDEQDKASLADNWKMISGTVATVVCPLRGIGKVRQWIVDNHNVKKYGPNILMLDDDLRFFVRRKDDTTKFLPAGDNDIMACMAELENVMRVYAHAGILAREGGNRVKSSVKVNTRLLRALAYNVHILRKLNVRFDRLKVMEDFGVALQLIEKGHANIALCNWVQDQTRSNAPGGCSTYRDLLMQDQGARMLRDLHPDFVSVVRKKTTTAWNGKERSDVKIFWGRAYASSQK